MVGAEVRGLHLDFAYEGVVDVLEVGAEVAGVGQVRAVELDRNAGHRRAVGGIGRRLTDLDLREIGRGVLRSEIADREAGQMRLELGCVAADDGQPIESLAVIVELSWPQSRGSPADLGIHRDGLGDRAHLEPEAGQSEGVAGVQVDVGLHQLVEPGLGDSEGVVTAGDRRKGK